MFEKNIYPSHEFSCGLCRRRLQHVQLMFFELLITYQFQEFPITNFLFSQVEAINQIKQAEINSDWSKKSCRFGIRDLEFGKPCDEHAQTVNEF